MPRLQAQEQNVESLLAQILGNMVTQNIFSFGQNSGVVLVVLRYRFAHFALFLTLHT